MNGPAVRIGRSNTYVTVAPIRRERPDATDYSDGNWTVATITIAAGGFRGEFEAQLRAEDFVSFRDELRPLHENLVGRARFDTTEGWLSIDIEGDGGGHFHADCVAVDLPGTGNRLLFGIDFDQTDLPEILAGRDVIIGPFPDTRSS